MCGLKQNLFVHLQPVRYVTPFVGVWIETDTLLILCHHHLVTPFVGVWIETEKKEAVNRGRIVTPFVGVWIETALPIGIRPNIKCHTLRGCVD